MASIRVGIVDNPGTADEISLMGKLGEDNVMASSRTDVIREMIIVGIWVMVYVSRSVIVFGAAGADLDAFDGADTAVFVGFDSTGDDSSVSSLSSPHPQASVSASSS